MRPENPKVSFVIPIFKTEKYIKRCILSIKEQDYKNTEIVCVLDGKSNKALKVLEQFPEVKVLEQPHCGAAAARNRGYMKTTGDILFFFDSDCVLLPGMLRLCVDTLNDNPDCAFVYGAYRFNVDSLNTYPSRDFDPYLLRTMNYISTMSPMWKDTFCGFNETLPYFQDWDMFLRMVKRGHKGKWIKDVLFITEEQTPDSISGNQKVPFIDKWNHIRELNNISSKICVTTLGAPIQAIQRAKMLNADYLGAHYQTPLIQTPAMFGIKPEVIYCFGFYPLTIQDHAALFQGFKGIRIVHWIGTDVYQLRNKFSFNQIKYMKEHIFNQIDVHLTNSPWLYDELSEMGIHTELVYTPIFDTFDIVPLPSKFTVGVYYSETNPMHNEKFILDVAKAMPDIDFIFFGGSHKEHDKNIRFEPHTDIKDIIKQCSLNVRITVHDGWPQTPIQFLMSGREVIINSDMPYMNYLPCQLSEATYANAKADLINKIREVKKKFHTKKYFEGAKAYYEDLMSVDAYRDEITRVIANVRQKDAVKK